MMLKLLLSGILFLSFSAARASECPKLGQYVNCVGTAFLIGNYSYMKFEETTIGTTGVQAFGIEYAYEDFPNDPSFGYYVADGKPHASSEYISRCEKGVLITEYHTATGSRKDYVVLEDGRLKILYYSTKTMSQHNHEWLCDVWK